MQKLKIIFLSAGILLLAGCGQENMQNNSSDSGLSKSPVESTQNANNIVNNSNNNQAMNDNTDYKKQYSQATIKTNMGEIKVKFNADSAPKTVNNFLKLATEKFYDGTKFHRVIKGFMIQGGDPLSKDASKKDYWGTGGPGYKFADELTGQEKYNQGVLAMANAGPNTNGSQFFIVTASPSVALPPSYTIFGQVVAGMDVALKIENVKTGVNDRPVEDVTIESIVPEK